MTSLVSIAARSAWTRRFALSLVMLCIALSTFLLLGMERVRQDTRAHFAESVSGTDVIVGPRTGSMQLLLYSVFRIGSPANNIGWESLEALRKHPAVAWIVPLSLGDSHHGFPVIATSVEYFTRFRYGDARTLDVREGRAFAAGREAVLGAEVARRAGYRLGDRIVLAHGDGALAENDHADQPFTVVGIFARTGTPVDRSVHISLEAMDALHREVGSAMAPGIAAPPAAGDASTLPQSVTAALVGLKSRAAVFAVQRWVADYSREPLQAILPGVALDELWGIVGIAEAGLVAMGALVSIVGIAGMVAVILAGLDQRRRELAILRAVGAGPRHVLALLALEGGLVTLCGVALGALACTLATPLLSAWFQSEFGIRLRFQAPSTGEGTVIVAMLCAGALASLLPALRAYRLSLIDGLSPRT